ncbi:MAG: ABC transporter permease [Lentisphaeria bacterium]|nr:ABC transporter permease [Lentisphaeria bacterium]
MSAFDIGYTGLALSYLLLIPPLAVILWLRLPMVGQTLLSVARMTAQLLFVGFYLQVIFKLENPWLTMLWLATMITVADVTVLRGCGLRVKPFALALGVSLALGTAIPLAVFVGLLLRSPNLLDPRYVIPLAGMILGNCLRADIVGVKSFYASIRSSRVRYQQRIAYGADFQEAVRPFFKEACQNALTPTIAGMASIGLVALPGMMTGVILGGTSPAVAIKYQIAIMLAILCGTAITIFLAILLSLRVGFDDYGNLNLRVFREQ